MFSSGAKPNVNAGQRRLLEVEVVGCTDIIGVNNRGRESDSFVSVPVVFVDFNSCLVMCGVVVWVIVCSGEERDIERGSGIACEGISY